MKWLAVCIGGFLWLPTTEGGYHKIVNEQGQQRACRNDEVIDVVASPLFLEHELSQQEVEGR